jgi:hypothetical protein
MEEKNAPTLVAAVDTSPKLREKPPELAVTEPVLLLSTMEKVFSPVMPQSSRKRVPPSSLLELSPSLPLSTWPECEPPIKEQRNEMLTILLNFDKNTCCFLQHI